MRFSLDWLRQYVDLPEPPARVAEALAASGLPVEGLEAWGADHRLDIDVLSNRPDCMGHIGLARELAARLQRPLRLPPAEPRRDATRTAAELASVTVEAPELCGRYSAVVLTGVRVAPSPDWLEDRLTSIGLRPINNVVDVTNFVLWETGQPLHAFDLDRLEGHRIVVRRAGGEESLKTLDGLDRRLTPEQLVIADARRPVALAGVMGGAGTQIGPATARVLLESAHFAPLSVRRTSRAHGLHTDASHRFERGADPAATLFAARRAADLIARVSGGEVAAGDLDVLSGAVERRRLELRLDRLARLLGFAVEAGRAAAALARLGFEVRSPAGSDRERALPVTVPTWRVDVEREVDLIEEVARLIGYDAVPSTLPAFLTARSGATERRSGVDRTRTYMAACGFREALTFPLADPGRQAPFQAGGGGALRPVVLDNPMSPQMSVLRTSLLPGLLAAVAWNRNRGFETIRLFEVGRVFGETAGAGPGAGPGGVLPLPEERAALAAAACGVRGEPHWSRRPEAIGLHDLSGVLEEWARRVCGGEMEIVPEAAAGIGFLRPGSRAAVRLGGRVVGHLGALAPGIAADLGLDDEVLVFEVDLAPAGDAAPAARYRPLPRFPASERDLALVVDASVPFSRLARVLREEGGELLESLRPFDRYTGGSLPQGRISLAVRLSFRHPERTLTAGEVREVQDRMVARLRAECGAVLREA